MKCEKVTIEVFMDAWFNHEFENISKEDFQIVYTEYIDLAGLYQSKEFELYTYINYLKNRAYVLRTVVDTQKLFYETFKQPYIEGLEFVKESFGFNYEWTGNEKSFFSFLRKLSNTERTKMMELKRKEFEFTELKKKKQENNMTDVQSRHEFIKMLNSFNKSGYKIDRHTTTIEELALMIKQTQDDSKRIDLERIQNKQ